MNALSSLWAKLARSKKYRESFAASVVKRMIPMQIRVLRKQRDWPQARLATEANLTQGVISRAEDPDYGNLTVNTLVRIGAGFDCAFVGRFVPFSELTRWYADLANEKALEVPSFDDESEASVTPTTVGTLETLMGATSGATDPYAQRKYIRVYDALLNYQGGPYGRLLESGVFLTPLPHAAMVGNRGSIAPAVSIPSVASAMSIRKPPKQETGQNLEQISVQIVPGGRVTTHNQLVGAGS